MASDDDIDSDPAFIAYKQRVREELLPMIQNSAVSISIVPHSAEPDVKFSIELGLCIMLNKPILLFARSGDDIPPKLRLVADEIIIADGVPASGSPEGLYVQARIDAFIEKYGPKNDDD